MTDTQEPGLSAMVATIAGGWIALSTLGFATTLYSGPVFALALVSAIGIACSLKGFGGCEMLVAMIVSTVLGALLIPLTPWAWVAPMLPGGFMVSVVFADILWD